MTVGQRLHATAVPGLDVRRTTRTGPRHPDGPETAGDLTGRGRSEGVTVEWAGLGGILVAAACLYGWQLSRQGWANAYYAQAAAAGARSWRVMLFGGLDPGFAVATDKPPLALWLMTVSVRVFGLHGWSVLLPQLLASLATIAVLHRTVRLVASPPAAFTAAVVLTVTPVFMVLARFDDPDTVLTLLCTTAAYTTIRATLSPWPGWLPLTGALVGAAFLTKWLVVLLVVPGLVAGYVLRPGQTFPSLGRLVTRMIRATVVIGAVAVLVAGWWVALIAATPARSRPFLDGSRTDSVWDLVLGRNGFSRLGTRTVLSLTGGTPPGGWDPISGAPGPTRLLTAPFASQIAWFLPWAQLGLVVSVWACVRAAPAVGPLGSATVVWGGWLLVAGAVFSLMSGPMHPYYTVLLAPPAAALVGLLIDRLVAWPGPGSPARRQPRRVGAALTIALLALLLGPAAVDRSTVTHAVTGGNPLAGGGSGLAPHSPSALVAFLREHQGPQTWQAAVPTATPAALLALDSTAPVLPLGGFVGNVPNPTLAQFQHLVRAGRVHYLVLLGPYQHSPLGTVPQAMLGTTAAVVIGWAERVGHRVQVPGSSTTVLDLTASATPPAS